MWFKNLDGACDKLFSANNFIEPLLSSYSYSKKMLKVSNEKYSLVMQGIGL